MKKISAIILLGLCILISSCNKEEITNKTLNQKSQNNGHFYGVKTPEPTRGVAQIKKLWYPGTTIDIKFLNGSEQFQQKVKTYAAQWEQYANINFNFVEQGDADVRITFDANNSRYVTWSTIGTDCKMIIDQSEPTMNFVDWRYSLEKEIKADVLRAFGQVLGLELEHRQTDFDAGWRDNISLYWEGSLSDIPWEELKKYVFDPLEKTKILETEEYDENSIMIWPFPRQFALNTARDHNFELSEKDIEFVSEVYPKEKEKEVPIATIKPGSKNYGFGINVVTDLTIDWGDGTIEIIYPGPNNFYYHNYPENFNGNYTISLYGEEYTIINLDLDNCYSTDVSRCTGIKNLSIRGIEFGEDDFSNLDISNNIFLEQLAIIFANFTELDLCNNINLKYAHFVSCHDLESLNLSECTELEIFECTSTNVQNLDISNCTKLTDLYCSHSNISTLDLLNNSELKYLDCSYNALFNLDLSNNINLIKLNCRYNDLNELNLSNCSQIENIECPNNPFVTNQENFEDFANSLPDRTENTPGILISTSYPEESKNWVIDILNEKNWSFQ